MNRDPQNGSPRAADLVSEITRAVSRRRVWVASVALLALGAFGVWIAGAEPVYRASATVLLETGRSSTGVLGELAALTAPPAAASEIAVLRSRSLAQAVAQDPDSDSSALGLATLVDDRRRRPLATWLARFGLGAEPRGTVHARVFSRDPSAPERLWVRFAPDQSISFRTPGLFRSVEVVLEPSPSGRYQVHGWDLELRADGAASGGTFSLWHLGHEAAVRRVQRNTRVVESTRNSGVLELTVSDSDPHRAAAIANALCVEYFEQNVARGRRRASETVDFIHGQLAAQQAALEQAEREVVELQRTHPDLIDRASSAKALVTTASDFAVRSMQLGLVEASLSEALRLLEQGDLAALSRLGPELSDPMSVGLVEQIATLELELSGVERAERNDPRPLLFAHTQELSARADELELQVEALQKIILELRGGHTSSLGLLAHSPDAGVLADPLTLGLVAELVRVDGEVQRLSAAFTDVVPELVRARASREELLERIASNLTSRRDGLVALLESRRELVTRSRGELENLVGEGRERLTEALAQLRQRTREHLVSRLDALRLERRELESIGETLEQRLGALPEMERALAHPLRRLETHKELTTFLLRSLQEAEITRASSIASAQYIDPAVAPDRRYAPRLGLGLGFALLAGAALAIGLAVCLERMRSSLRGTRELEAAAGLPVLGTIPYFERKGQRGRVFLPMRDAPDGPIAEAYRSLRANLRFAVESWDELRTLAVTSSAPGEGKSTTNVDLALALASAGKRVLLVDGDLRRPAVHRYLELAEGPGLAEVLSRGAHWRELVQRLEGSSLDVLVAGRHRGAAGELLSGERSLECMAEFSADYDLVVYDLPPALVVADVETFAHRLDALLLLYREDGLPRQAVESAVRRLRQSGARLVGAILNASRARASEGGGYYGSYYGSHYYTDGSSAAPEAPAALPARTRRSQTAEEVH